MPELDQIPLTVAALRDNDELYARVRALFFGPSISWEEAAKLSRRESVIRCSSGNGIESPEL